MNVDSVLNHKSALVKGVMLDLSFGTHPNINKDESQEKTFPLTDDMELHVSNCTSAQ